MNFEMSAYRKCSELAQNLINSCVCELAENRINLNEILRHKWFDSIFTMH